MVVPLIYLIPNIRTLLKADSFAVEFLYSFSSSTDHSNFKMGSINHSQESQTTNENTTPNPFKIKNGQRRLAPQVIAQLALTDPSHLISMTAKSPTITDFHNLPVLQLSHAINHMSHHIDSLLGK